MASRSNHKVEVNGVDFHYEKAGNGDHVVLLLPGCLGCTKTDFNAQLDGLNGDKYTLIGFDPRGYGGSRPPTRDWPLHFYQRDAEDAFALMQKLGYPQFSILGWSDGANTGMIVSGMFPENVRKLLVWGGNSYATVDDLKLYNVLGDLDQWNDTDKAPYLAQYGDEYLRSQLKQWSKASERYVHEKNGDICMGSLPKITCETLIIHGHKDVFITVDQSLFLKKHITNSRMLEWTEAPHNLHSAVAEEFNKVAEEFLDS